MEIKRTTQPPTQVSYFESWDGPGHEDIEERMTPKHVADVVEIFQTPLTGHYNWDYSTADGRIRKLYKLGKELNWNADLDLDWSQNFDKSQSPLAIELNPLRDWEPYEALSQSEKRRMAWHNLAWRLSQFVHGEQGALLVASQLASCAPTYDAKLYAASQTFDEARHVEVFNRYLQDKIGIVYPVNKNLKLLLDKILTDARWDLKFIGMQIIIEGLALAAFNNLQSVAKDPLLKRIIDLVVRDEARHVTFGVNYLTDFVETLTDEEREDRASFAFEACAVMRDRLIGVDVFEEFGLDPVIAREKSLQSTYSEEFRNLLFKRVMPNLKRIGLLTDKIRPRFEELGVLEYENLADDGVLDWAELSRPLYETVNA